MTAEGEALADAAADDPPGPRRLALISDRKWNPSSTPKQGVRERPGRAHDTWLTTAAFIHSDRQELIFAWDQQDRESSSSITGSGPS
jgi:hypothetical protein